MPTVVFIQFTNPEAYPPLEHSSQMLVNAGMTCVFLARENHLTGKITFRQIQGRTIEWYPFEFSWMGNRTTYLLFTVWALVKVLWVRPKMVYLSDPLSTPIGTLLLTLGFSCIYHEHDSPDDTMCSSPLMTFRKFVSERTTANVFPNELRAQRTLSSKALRTLQIVRNFPEAREVVPAKGSQHEVCQLIYFGSIVPSRLPLAFFEELGKQERPLQFHLIGYDPTELGNHLSAIEHVFNGFPHLQLKYHGALPRNQMLEIARGCDVGLLLFSKTQDINESAMSGASNKIYDYLAAGIPMVCFESKEFDELKLSIKGIYPFSESASTADLICNLQHKYASATARKELQEQILNGLNYEQEFERILHLISKP